MSSPDDVPAILDRLVTAWCERRALAPLRQLLPAYPPSWNLSDDCYELLDAMKNVRGLSKDSLTSDEYRELTRAMILLQDALEHR
jgi:hypothetical protein